MNDDVIGRILSRAKELGLSPRAASLASGMGSTAIRDIVKRPGHSVTMETMTKLAGGLQTTPEWLAFGNGDSPSEKQKPDRVVPNAGGGFVLATYGGIVEAGTFREVGEFEDPDREPDFVPRDERFPRAAYFVFDVAGDSMNAADPPMKAGSRVVAVRFENFRNRLTLQSGDIVVIERTLEDGALRERSVKELELGEEETRFCPRSTNLRHQPIVVPKDFEADDATNVSVLGVVIDVMTKVRRR